MCIRDSRNIIVLILAFVYQAWSFKQFFHFIHAIYICFIYAIYQSKYLHSYFQTFNTQIMEFLLFALNLELFFYSRLLQLLSVLYCLHTHSNSRYINLISTGICRILIPRATCICLYIVFLWDTRLLLPNQILGKDHHLVGSRNGYNTQTFNALM